MSYEPTEWATGDVVTATKLNKLEKGVEGAGVLIVNITDSETMTLDKTWQEIHDAGFAIVHVPDQRDNRITHCWPVEAIYTATNPGGTLYCIDLIGWAFIDDAYVADQFSLTCTDPDEYPSD